MDSVRLLQMNTVMRSVIGLTETFSNNTPAVNPSNCGLRQKEPAENLPSRESPAVVDVRTNLRKWLYKIVVETQEMFSRLADDCDIVDIFGISHNGLVPGLDVFPIAVVQASQRTTDMIVNHVDPSTAFFQYLSSTKISKQRTRGKQNKISRVPRQSAVRLLTRTDFPCDILQRKRSAPLPQGQKSSEHFMSHIGSQVTRRVTVFRVVEGTLGAASTTGRKTRRPFSTCL